MITLAAHPSFPISREARWLADGIQSGSDACAAEALRALIAELGEPAALEFASRNEVACIMGHASPMVQAEYGIETSRFASVHAEMQVRIARYMGHLDRIAAAFAADDIPIVALKNAGIARGLYPCLGCCPMGDVDVLVRRSDFRQAHAILVELGFQFEFRSPLEVADAEIAELTGGTEYWLPEPDGSRFWLELQWRPVAGRWIRPDQEPNGDDLLDRSLAIPGTYARILSPEDNLLQVALHTAKHSYVRAPGFRLHTDVDRIVRRQQINWDVFVSYVQAMQVVTPVYFSLLLAVRLLGTPIPEHIFDELRVGRAKRNWIARQLTHANLLEPHADKFGRLQYMLFNAALYDDGRGLWRALFPDALWMHDHYGIASRWLLPWGYFRRGLDIAFRRVKT